MADSNPNVSVIVPVYNVAPYIEEALRSVVGQTLDGCIEIIVVDDCGSDDSFEIAQEYAKRAMSPTRQFKFLSNGVNKGQAAARNLGLLNATGEYVAFLDSDDCLMPDNLKVLLDTIQNRQVDIVEASTLHFGDDNQKDEAKAHKEDLLTGIDILTGLSTRWMPVMWNKIFRRSFLIDNDLFCPEGFFYEDLFWAFKTMVTAQSIYTIPNQLYRYRMRSDSTSHSLTQRHVDSFIKLIWHMKSFVENANLRQHPYFEYIASNYERTRCLAIDYVYTSGTKDSLKFLLNGLSSTNISALKRTFKNRNLSYGDKCKILALQMKPFCYAIFEIKRQLDKFKRK